MVNYEFFNSHFFKSQAFIVLLLLLKNEDYRYCDQTHYFVSYLVYLRSKWIVTLLLIKITVSRNKKTSENSEAEYSPDGERLARTKTG
jgi:hypothetical protein